MAVLWENRLGRVTFEPDAPVVAGSMDQWTLIYTAGSYGIDEGGTLMLVQRTACDWQAPQFDKPDQAGFTTVTTNGKARLALRFQRKRHVRPWQAWCLVIDVHDGYLSPGDTVTLVLGDRSQGAPGIRAQSFVESAHEFRILVDPTNAALVRRLPTSPLFPIVAGKPDRLVCILPTEMGIGESAEIFVKGEDRWGNPTPAPLPVSFSLEGDGGGKIEEGHITAVTPGTIRIRAAAGNMTCGSNPVIFLEKRPAFSKYWGDLHAQTDSTVGTGTEEEYFIFGRDMARLDFISHQGNDFQVTDKDWKRLSRTIKDFNEPGKFVVFPGYEWSGNTAAGGDHNVIYLKDDQPIFRSCHWQIPKTPEDDKTPAHPIDQLYRRLNENGNAVLIPHVGGRYADIRSFFDDALIPVVEIVSCWGVFEWMLWDAVEKGHRVGVVCNSDGHKGRPGAEGPGAGEFGIYGGLTCVLAESLSREAVFQALQARRCYGTTGVRMVLDFSANGLPMGSFLETSDPVELFASVQGTGPLEAIHLFKGRENIKTVRAEEFHHLNRSNRIRISWEGALIRGRARRATWNGAIRAKGTAIETAQTFAFDSPADGIVDQNGHYVTFKSSTTGDVDGIDLVLKNSSTGHVEFESPLGNCRLNLSDLREEPLRFDFGGLGLKVTIQRYPQAIQTERLSVSHSVRPEKGKVNPFLVKAVQEDGHTAWSSPIYIKA